MFKIYLIFLTILGSCHTKRNYDITLTSFEMSPNSDPTWIDKGTLRIMKKTRNQFVLSGTVYIFKNSGNDGNFNLVVYNVGFTGNLIPVYAKQAKFCDYIKTEKMMYPGLLKKSDLPPRDLCPFPKGNYTVTDYVIDEEQLPEMIPSGEFKGVASYNMDNKFIYGYECEFTVAPHKGA